MVREMKTDDRGRGTDDRGRLFGAWLFAAVGRDQPLPLRGGMVSSPLFGAWLLGSGRPAGRPDGRLKFQSPCSALTQTSQVSKRMEMPGCNLFWVKSSCIEWW